MEFHERRDMLKTGGIAVLSKLNLRQKTFLQAQCLDVWMLANYGKGHSVTFYCPVVLSFDKCKLFKKACHLSAPN